MTLRSRVFLGLIMVAGLLASTSAVAAQGVRVPEQVPHGHEDESPHRHGEESPHTHDEEVGHHHGPALGEYGRSGPITRDQLPEGIRDTVSDEALLLANSEGFQSARQAWAEGIDFVGQIDYQLRYRSRADFLKISNAELAAILEKQHRNEGGIVERGLFLTDDEVAEKERRAEIGSRTNALVREAFGDLEPKEEGDLVYHENFVGIWMDQMNRGTIVLGVVDPSRLDHGQLERTLGGELQIVKQDFSLEQMHEHRESLARQLVDLGVEYDLAIRATPTGMKLVAITPMPDALPDSFGMDLPEGSFSVEQGRGMTPANTADKTHIESALQPGLLIGIVKQSVSYTSFCTWGFNAHAPNRHYAVTAGHCFGNQIGYANNTGAIAGPLEVYQKATGYRRNLTPGSFYVRTRWTSAEDFARFSTQYADDNCYHGAGGLVSAHCQWKMKNRAIANSWTVGVSETCASRGMSGMYDCGDILEENVLGPGQTSGPGRMVRVGIENAISGDSGSGAKWGHTIDGVITDTNAPAFTQVLMHTAYDVKEYLNVDYNCGSGTVRHAGNPGAWPACPTVWRG